MHRTWLLILLLVPIAAGQPGPMPGYQSAVEYAADHATTQVDNASADPVGYAGSKASVEALEAEAAHAAYMACWAADDAGVEHETCDPYYTPAGEADPEQPEDPCQCNVTADGLANQTANATQDLLNETVDATQDFLDDPSDPPGFLKRVHRAVERFVDAVVQGVSAFGTAIAGAVLLCLGLLGTGLTGAAGGVTSLGQAAMDLMSGMGAAVQSGLHAGGSGFVEGLIVTGDGLVWMLAGAGDGIAVAAQAVWGGLSKAATAIGSGIAAAAKAVGSGVATAAGAVGDAVVGAASSIKDAVLDLFGQGQGESAPAIPDAVPDAEVPVDDGLVDGLLEALE